MPRLQQHVLSQTPFLWEIGVLGMKAMGYLHASLDLSDSATWPSGIAALTWFCKPPEPPGDPRTLEQAFLIKATFTSLEGGKL